MFAPNMRHPIGVASRRSSLPHSHSQSIPLPDNSIGDPLHLSGSLKHVLLILITGFLPSSKVTRLTAIDLFTTSNPNLDPYRLHSDAPSNPDSPRKGALTL